MNVPIVLWSHDVIKLLEVGNHITYMPKAKGTLYVGYTKYPNLPKTQEGYLRQGKDVEDDFILFKQGLLELKDTHREDVVPEVLYLEVEKELVPLSLKNDLFAPEGRYITLLNSESKEEKEKKSNDTLVYLTVQAQQMQEDGYELIKDMENRWHTQKIPFIYLSYDKIDV